MYCVSFSQHALSSDICCPPGNPCNPHIEACCKLVLKTFKISNLDIRSQMKLFLCLISEFTLPESHSVFRHHGNFSRCICVSFLNFSRCIACSDPIIQFSFGLDSKRMVSRTEISGGCTFFFYNIRHFLSSLSYTSYSFTAPAVRPPTMYFCRNTNNRITGSTKIAPYAIIQFHLVPYLLWNL